MAINQDYLAKINQRKHQNYVRNSVSSLSNIYKDNYDPNTSEGLINLAMQKGGMSAEVIGELAHPQKSILSTIGNSLKNLGSGFIDVISAPGEIVSGVILGLKDSEMSISQGVRKALKEDITVSTTLFGDYNKVGKTGLQKVGNFIGRFAIDTLFDPLTYLTFGSARGIVGLSGAPKITAGVKLAETIGVKAGRGVALAEGVGDDTLRFIRESMAGNNTDDLFKSLVKRGVPREALEKGVKEVTEGATKILDNTVVDIDAARVAMTQLLEAQPALTKTVLDKGGIKFFGQTILESQKIKTVASLIPGMKMMDRATEPARLALSSLFDPSVVKAPGGGYKYVPQEWLSAARNKRRLTEKVGDDLFQQFDTKMKAMGIKTADQFNTIMNEIMTGKIGADKVNQELYKFVNQVGNIDSYLALKAGGVNMTYLPNRLQRLFYKGEGVEATKNMKNSFFEVSVDAAQKKQNVAFESVTGGKTLIGKEGDDALEAFSAKKLKETGDIDVTQIDTVIAKQVKLLDDSLEKLSKEGLEGSSELMEDILQQKHDIKSGKMENVFVDKKSGDVFFRRSATLDETLSIKGYELKDVDWVQTISQDVFRAHKQAVGSAFTDDIRRFGVPASEAPSHFIPIDSQKIGINLSTKNAEELVFDPQIADGIIGMVESATKEYNPSAFLEAYDSITGVWKASVTSIFPSFHARNAVSNVMLNFADIGFHAFDPRKWNTAGDMITKNFKYDSLVKKINKANIGSEKYLALKDDLNILSETTVFKDNLGHSWTFGEMRDTLIQKDVAFTHNATAVKAEEIRGTSKVVGDTIFKGKKEKAKSFVPVFNDFYGYKLGREVGGAVENHGRLINFLTNLEKTGDVTHAASRTKQFLFDYGNLTDFERNTMRRIIPFYSFSRFNMEVQAKALMSTPGRTAQQLRGVQTFQDIFSQEELTDEQKELLPDWMQKGFTRLKKSRDGTLKVVSGFESPIMQPFEQLSAKGVLGSVSPLIRVPIEQLTGYDMYHGKVFSDVTNAAAYKNAPKAIKDLIGYDEVTWTDPKTGKKNTWSVSLRPARMNIINNLPPTSRVISSIRDVTNEDTTRKEKALRTLFGVNTYDVDFERLAKQREKELLKQYTDVLDTSGVIYKFQKNITPKEE